MGHAGKCGESGLRYFRLFQRLLEYSVLVGASFDKEEEESVLSVWRYTGHLMGIPETILYTSAADAKRTYQIGFMCEPPADADSIRVANLLIKAIPSVADITDPVEREHLIKLAYTLSRALIGNKLANQFEFPKTFTVGVLLMHRMKQRIQQLLKSRQLVRSDNFSQLLQISVYDKGGLSYRMPNHVYSSKSIEW